MNNQLKEIIDNKDMIMSYDNHNSYIKFNHIELIEYMVFHNYILYEINSNRYHIGQLYQISEG